MNESHPPQSREAAQRATERIAAFTEELASLERAGVLHLTLEQQEQLHQYHTAQLAAWRTRFDVDACATEMQLSLGMKVASFFAALALSAAVFYFCYQFWGRMGTAIQVTLLCTATLGTTLASLHFAARERTSYFAKIFGLIACVCFALNISLMGRMFNLTPRPTVFLVAALFAGLLAYACEARLLLIFAICNLAAWLGACVGEFSGCYWLGFDENPECFFAATCALFALSLIPHRNWPDFPPQYRIWALLFWFLPVLLLSHWGSGSHLPLSDNYVEWGYQLMGFVSAALVVFAGIRCNWPETVQTGVVFFTIFLSTKFFDWWWEWMPKSLFFLLLGLVALLVLLFLRRLRTASGNMRQHLAEARP